MIKATLKPDSIIRIRNEIAEMTGFLDITTADCEKMFQSLESRMENGESLNVEIATKQEVVGFVNATEADFDIEQIED